MNKKGFTLLEMMVGLVIFSIGALGFVGMTMMTMKGTQISKGRNEAATLTQSLIENLSGHAFEDLGTNTTLPAPFGLDNAVILTEGPLNREGQTIGGGATGPFRYYRYSAICDDLDGVGAGSPQAYCGSIGDSNRPQELACDNLSLGNREKMIRVVVSYTDRAGACKKVHLDSLAFDWDG